MHNSKPILYALECDHAAPGPATLVSGVLRCAWCQTERVITRVIEYEWRAKCQQCTFARWSGLSKHNAGIMANGHAQKNPTHKIMVEYTRNPEASKTAMKMQSYKSRRVS